MSIDVKYLKTSGTRCLKMGWELIDFLGFGVGNMTYKFGPSTPSGNMFAH